MGKNKLPKRVTEPSGNRANASKVTKAERQRLKREATEQALDNYFDLNIHVGIEHLNSLRNSKPDASPREILNIMSDSFLKDLRTADHNTKKASLHQEFILGALAVYGPSLQDDVRRRSIKILTSKLSRLKLSRALKGAANGAVLVAEVALEIFPVFKNAKFLKKFKNVKPATLEKGAKLAVQAGVGVAGKVVNTPRGSNGDSTIDKLFDVLGPAPKYWPDGKSPEAR